MPRTAAIDGSDERDKVRARYRKLPSATTPNDDATTVRTNLTEEEVRVSQNTLAYHIAHHPGSKIFGNKEAGRLQLVEAYIRLRDGRGNSEASDFRAMHPDDLEAVTVCELVVEEGMLSVRGTLAGSCATHMIDLATFAPLLLLSAVIGVEALGLSSSMSIVWHAPAVRGSTLRFVGTSLSLKRRTATARCEVYNKKSGALLISAIHIVTPVQSLPFAVGTDSGAKKQENRIPRAKL